MIAHLFNATATLFRLDQTVRTSSGEVADVLDEVSEFRLRFQEGRRDRAWLTLGFDDANVGEAWTLPEKVVRVNDRLRISRRTWLVVGSFVPAGQEHHRKVLLVEEKTA